MSTRYEESGRTQQKQRTRSELVSAARTLIANGGSAPTVADAATAASISRTTAYRYFPSQRALLAAAHPETVSDSMLPPDIGDDPAQRLAAAIDTFTRVVLDTENQQRIMLRLSLEFDGASLDLPLRKGRAIGWFEEALRPLEPRLTSAGVHKLAIAIRSVVGIESLVWLIDVAGFSRDDAVAVVKWSAQALLAHAMSDALPGVRRRRGR